MRTSTKTRRKKKKLPHPPLPTTTNPPDKATNFHHRGCKGHRKNPSLTR
jgi:hypothetical protein